MTMTPTQDQLRRDLRARICSQCPLRPVGACGKDDGLHVDKPLRCEAECPLFLKLPFLTRRAALVDPMLRSREATLGHLIQEPVGSGTRTPLKRTNRWLLKHYGDEVARVIAARFHG